jgi:hypothetical protein
MYLILLELSYKTLMQQGLMDGAGKHSTARAIEDQLVKMQEVRDRNHRGQFIRIVELVGTAATIARLVFDIIYTIADLQNRDGSRQL